MAMKSRTVFDRALDKFTLDDGCWEWTGSLNKGYGQINSGGRGRPLAAHRVVYEMVKGPVPEGLQLDHLCRNRKCVKPDHLEPVTQAENKARGDAGLVHRDRMASKTHCKRGHEFTDANTYMDKNPNGNRGRSCRKCKALRERDRRARLRANHAG